MFLNSPFTRRALLSAGVASLTAATLATRRRLGAAAPEASRHPFGRPLVFAHRGASGERPEHTLAAYRLAMEQGADYVEPDLRLTKDGVFICLHDATLERTTDVAARLEFAPRSKPNTKGLPRWHAADFTLAEIKSLSIRQGNASRARHFAGVERVPTFSELVDLVRQHNADQGTAIGITPELKNSDAEAFLAFVGEHALETGGGAGPAVPLHVQSFDLPTVLAVRPRLASPCVWLTGKRPADAMIADLAGKIDGISIAKHALLADAPAAFVDRLHTAGHCVVCWTFADDHYDAKRYHSSAEELAAALATGVDALFTDFPASGVAARDRFVAAK